MNKTKIEWCDYAINPVKGLCPMACSYCYARAMYKRFKWNPEIRMEPDWQEELPKKPAKVFVGSTMELFGDWVEDWMWDSTWQYVNSYPQHTFIFLTKQPQNLIKWSPFPKNCWVGVSATGYKEYVDALAYLVDNKASVKYISFEPLLSWDRVITNSFAYSRELGHAFDDRQLVEEASINWVIIGQQTPVKLSTMPKVGWVEEIVTVADKANIPVFLKDNLISCVDQYPFAFNGIFPDIKLRQEFPRGMW